MKRFLRDATLIVGVGGSLIATGAVFHDFGDRLPPPPAVEAPAPATEPGRPVAPPAPHDPCADVPPGAEHSDPAVVDPADPAPVSRCA